MEPQNKFDYRVKQLLEERELQPSKNGWKALEKRLEKAEKKPVRRFWWLGAVAALILAFFLIGNALFTSTAPQKVQVAEENTSGLPPTSPEEASSEDQIVVSESTAASKKPASENPVKNDIFGTPSEITSEEKIANNDFSETSFEVRAVSEFSSEAKQISAHLDIKETRNSSEAENLETVTDLEVEALLLLAAAELPENRNYTVDAEDLLQSVEFELDRSFREKVFEKLKDKFEKAKTAVANGDFQPYFIKN